MKEATQPGASVAQMSPQGGMGVMGSGRVPNLKTLDRGDRVQTISYCRDTYKVTTGDGKVHELWERNLRFKTDSSSDGPEKGKPAIVGAGLVGDRASVIFSAPDEINGFIVHKC